MSTSDAKQERLDGFSPAAEWDAHATKRVLDELICFAGRYRSSASYKELLEFVARFRFYAPYNAMLVHIKMPGATFVAPAHRWMRDFRQTVKSNARPLLILQPMGPVMFVFDVSDTEPGPDAVPLPPEVEKPFEVRRGQAVPLFPGMNYPEWGTTVGNAKRDGIRIEPRKEGSQSAGSIREVGGNVPPLRFRAGKEKNGEPKYVEIRARYDVLFNDRLNEEARYAAVVHELAHLYCGHLGTPNVKWWPDRRGLDELQEEFEAESVAYVVCGRLGIDIPSAGYLASYLGKNEEVPKISVDLVMKSAGLIEQTGRGRLKPRDDKSQAAVSPLSSTS